MWRTGTKSIAAQVVFPDTPSRNLKAQTVWHAADTPAPNLLVEPDVQTYVLRSHGLRGKLPDFLHSTWSPFLEVNTMQPLMEVDGVLACGGLFLTLLHHRDGLGGSLATC